MPAACEEDAAGRYILTAGCVRDCPPGQTDCYGECADLNADPGYCGDCGNVCRYDHAAALCVGGECQMGACDQGYADCDRDDRNGCEADLSTTETCGSCANSCQAGERCQDGSCTSRCQDNDKDVYNDAACGGDDCNDHDGADLPCQDEPGCACLAAPGSGRNTGLVWLFLPLVLLVLRRLLVCDPGVTAGGVNRYWDRSTPRTR